MEFSVPENNEQTLGVVAISFNEECDLPGFLVTLLPWVDEIVIVDDGSTDSTADIANAAGEKVKLVISPRKDGEYFADQRNKGIQVAESDWLLHMDIDERVLPGFAEEVRQAIQDTTKDGYKFRRSNFFLHRMMYGGGLQDWNMVHLARRSMFHFEGMFHETCILDAPKDRIGQLHSRMWHLNDTCYKVRMHKSLTYCEEQAKSIEARFKRITWLHLLCLPLFEFFRRFLLKKGYRDGTLGLLFAMHTAGAMFRACALVWDGQNRIARDQLEFELQEK